MIKNRRSRAMNRDLIGYSITREFPPIRHEDVADYVEATGDNPALYTGEKAPAPPFYLSRLLYPLFEHMMTLPGLDLNILRMVHGQQSAEWKNPLHLGESISVTMDIMDIVDTPAGEVIHLRTRAATGNREAFEAVTSFIVRGTGDRENAPHEPELVHGKEILRTEFQTFKGQQYRYAEVSQDKNFMHTSEILSRLAGLPRTILHGVCTTAMAINSLRDDLCGGDVEHMKGFSLRFARPVFPGEKIIVIVWEGTRPGEVYFEGQKESGTAVLKRGILHYTP